MFVHDRKKPNLLLYLAVLLATCYLPILVSATERPTLKGDISYAKPLKFDYDRDGKANTVQLWTSFEIRPAVGKEREPGYFLEVWYYCR